MSKSVLSFLDPCPQSQEGLGGDCGRLRGTHHRETGRPSWAWARGVSLPHVGGTLTAGESTPPHAEQVRWRKRGQEQRGSGEGQDLRSWGAEQLLILCPHKTSTSLGLLLFLCFHSPVPSLKWKP